MFHATYTSPILISHVTDFESSLDLFLELRRQLVVAINHVSVAIRCLFEVLDLLWCGATPVLGQRISNTTDLRFRAYQCFQDQL
jgi:hypothetical protein